MGTMATTRRDLILPNGKKLKAADITMRLDEVLEGYKPRDAWLTGPWTDEPDKVVWVDDETDLDCMVVRNNLGGLCGYVGVSEGHPYFRLPYGECPWGDKCRSESKLWCGHTLECQLEVHGGVTFTDSCQEGGAVCHVPRRGRPHDVWWIGFDCAHGGDFLPGMDAVRREVDMPLFFEYEVYRDLAYVVDEVENLAKQCIP